jgi:hypothetical protein
MTVLYSTGLHFNTIYVIESLAPGELRSGRELYDSILMPATHANEGLQAEYHDVRTSADLHRVLRRVAEECAERNRGPILHLEAHGDPNGLALADGSYLPWTALTPQLVVMNRACRMNLMVLAMMCKGWDLTVALMPNDRAPVFMLIGPPDAVSGAAIQGTTKRFYSTLVTKWDLNDALNSMNEGQLFAQWPIRPATAEILFCRVFRYYMQDLASGRTLQDRENKLVADIARANNLTVVDTAILRVEVRQRLTDHAWWYEHLRRTFLMIDLFPENAARFGLTYAKCLGDAA